MTTLEELAARVARLEERQDLATKADLLEVRRDIATMATGIGTDLRDIRGQLTTQGQNIGEIHQDIAEIRSILVRGIFRWPWEKR